MRRATLAVALLVVLVAAAELAAPAWVAGQAEDAVAAETGGRLEVDVDVSGPPLLLPVAASGRVESWRVRLARAAGRDVPLEVVVDLDDVVLDRGRLVRGDVVVTEVARARVRVRVDLSGTLPPLLRPFADRLVELGLDDLLGALGDGAVGRRGDDLVVGDMALPLVDGSCEVTADGGVVTTRCDLAEVPPLLLAAFD
jgi:hypothetical protein